MLEHPTRWASSTHSPVGPSRRTSSSLPSRSRRRSINTSRTTHGRTKATDTCLSLHSTREQQQEQLRGTVVQQRIDERQERRMAANSYGTLRRALLCELTLSAVRLLLAQLSPGWPYVHAHGLSDMLFAACGCADNTASSTGVYMNRIQ